MSLSTRHLLASFLLYCLATPSVCDGLRSWGMPQALSRFMDSVIKSRQANDNATHWALLIAGSGGYGNYRHQADVAHSYQIMRAGGLDPEHIIVMMADDVAFSVENPYPGELYNRPGGPNVYKDLKPVRGKATPRHQAITPVSQDYSGFKVTAQNFLAVLAGDQSALEPEAAGGPVLATGPNDHIFVYYADHGAPGILGMPWGPFLYADQLISTLEKKTKAKAFKEMVLFIEACESGSMFEGLLNAELPIYVTTAANAHESSWGTYCPGMAPSPPAEFTTCLGDLYSVAWLEEVDTLMATNQLNSETLRTLYKDVKQRTSNNFTYSMGSHVMQYGNLKISGETLDGWLEESLSPSNMAVATGSNSTAGHAIPARQAELVHLMAKARTLQGAEQEAALKAAQAMVSKQQDMDKVVRQAVHGLLAMSNAFETVQLRYAGEEPSAARLGQMSVAEVVVTAAPPAAVGKAVVDDWECLRVRVGWPWFWWTMQHLVSQGMVGAWERTCGALDGYTMQYTRAFANLCNFGFNPASLATSLEPLCSTAQVA